MDADNPFAPPKAVVADPAPATLASGQVLAFFPVSTTKLLVMSVFTLGLYQIYWFYKNWQMWRIKSGEEVTPALRAFFAVFFCVQLFKRVNGQAAKHGVAQFSAGWLAAGWIISSLAWRLPDPLWLLTYAGMFILPAVQTAINGINTAIAPGHDPNSRFTAVNWVWLVPGAVLTVLAIIGAFLPAPR